MKMFITKLISRRSPAWSIICGGLFLSSLVLPGYAHGSDQKPVKMKIAAAGRNFRAGESVEIQLMCLDSENNTAEVRQDYVITLLAHLPSGKADTMKVNIPAGAAEQKFSMKFQESGIIHLQARHDRLLQGETFIQVKARGKEQSEPPRKPQGAARSGSETFSLSAREQVSAQTASAYALTLRYSPQRTLLADGKDQAMIQAFVVDNDDSTTQEIRVRFFNNGGRLDPQPLIIPAGQDVGSATLTSQNQQTVTVEFVSATPAAMIQGDTKMQITFGPPITQLALDASPPVITLVDKSDLIIKLLDSDGKPVATEGPRKVSFTIASGRGDIETKELTIAAGGFEARTSFRPTWRGEVSISAATPNLQTASALVQVTLPVLVLALSVLGATLGGVIAYWRETGAQWWRIVLGLITGFVFYWAFVFGVLPLISREIVLNPLSALALSIIGGWLGTEVFNMVLKRLGLTKAN
ncbi:MAG: hypothetical protein AAB354_15630 [candidate division KSB1 bacterium]